MYIKRLLEKDITVALDNHKVLFLLGARQVGKTTLIEKMRADRKGAFLNMDVDAHRLHLEDVATLEPLEAVRALGGEQILIIDEAQRVSEIGRICKGWYDMKVPTKIVLLGSSSINLLQIAAGDLTGRNEKLWLTPLLFQEILNEQKWFRDSANAATLHSRFSNPIHSLLMERLVFGSYPEAYLSPQPTKYLGNLLNDYLLKDIFITPLVRQPNEVRRLMIELAKSAGQTISILQFMTRLTLNRKTVERYLSLLEAIFVIFKVPAYATDPIKEVHRSFKYYFWDTGVKNALLNQWVVSESRSDMGVLWENWVLAEIFKQGRTFSRPEDMFFWQSRNGSTVDLIVQQGETLHPFDIRWDTYGYHPSSAFTKAYGIPPKLIHPGNFLEYIL